MSTAHEKKYLRAIKAMKAAADALYALPRDNLHGTDSQRSELLRANEEYAAYLESATWWKGSP
jgi:hypothetical protein